LEDTDILPNTLNGCGQKFLGFSVLEGGERTLVLDGGAEDQAEEDIETADHEKEESCDEREVVDVMREDRSGRYPLNGTENTNSKVWTQDRQEVLEERKHVLGSGVDSLEIDKRVGIDKVGIDKSEFHQTGLDKAFTTEKKDVQDVLAVDKDRLGGGIHDDKALKQGEFHDSGHNWFKDSGVDKKEVMEERKHVLGAGTAEKLHELDQRGTDLAKASFVEEGRSVLGERTEKDRVDNTSNTFANKAGQFKDQVSFTAGQMKDSALEKGGQMKDAALEKGGQLKDAAAEKAFQLKDSAMDKGQQLKESAAMKGQQAKESVLEKGDQLKGKAMDAGHAVSEKGIAMKAAHDKGFAEQEARDKENVRN